LGADVDAVGLAACFSRNSSCMKGTHKRLG
jgi:hypothetical protein